MRIRIVALAITLAGCGPSGAPVGPVYVAPSCAAGFRGQIMAEGVSVDATDDAVYWQDHDYGTLQRQPRGGGPIETMVTEEHLTDSMRVAGGFVFWTSTTRGGLYRVPVVGGAPERIVATDQPLGPVEVSGDLVYAATHDGELLWWRSPSEQGVVEVSDEDVVLAAGPDALYVGSGRELWRLASPSAGLQDVLTTRAPITAVAASVDSVYWKEGDRLMRRVRGEVAPITRSTRDVVLAAVPGGLLFGESNVIYFAADELGDVVPVAITPAEITDLEVRGASVFVGTDHGSVHELCIDPAQPVALADPAPCDGTSCAWFASGALEADGDQTFYADGTPSGDFTDPDQARSFFVDGTEATGAPWSEP